MTSHPAFELVEERQLTEYNSVGRLFRHLATGAELLSVVNEDENKVFSINFRTTPEDSTGVAHILEHAVLNGSEKYPAKEPFVELLKGSLKTFVNAFTFPDKTCYPVASQNLQDFYNLIDVYMDAALHPLIPPHILDQEGWHYGVDEESGDLVYKGVVFNEMKGALSDPDDLLGEIIQQSMFPDNLYGFNSGGDPANIPDLTYEQFKQFHETYYHPSNAYIFWYGDDAEKTRLEKLAAYLEGYAHLDVDSAVPLQDAFETTRRITESYPVGEEEDPGHYIAVNWVLGEQTDPEVVLGLGILNHILIGTSGSPLRKALIDSEYGEDLVGGGVNGYLRQLTFSTGLKGVAEENLSKVEDLVLATLTSLAEEGIDPGRVAASMNTVEFALRENNTGGFPRGIALMLRALGTWLYDGDPFAPLGFEMPLTAIKTRLSTGEKFFESLVRKYLLDNPVWTVVILEPDPEMSQRLEEAEVDRLRAARQAMTEEDLQAVVEKAARLKEIQETPDSPEALASIPTLKLADLEKENKSIPLETSSQDGVEILYHELFTNGIVYLDLSFDLAGVPQEHLPYLGLFAGGLIKMGTEEEDFVQLSQRIGQHTGGISPSLLLQNKYHSAETTSRLVVRGKSTVDKVGEMLDILTDILLTTKFDNPERFRQILMERKARMEAGLIPSGHGVVAQRLKAGQCQSGWLSEQTGGLENLFFTRALLDRLKADWPEIVKSFDHIREQIVRRDGMLINLTLDRENWEAIRPQFDEFIEAIPVQSMTPALWDADFGDENEGLTIPAQVNYVGKGANIFELGYQPHGSMSVIRKYLGTTYIWEKIRVQGGAYGGFISFDLYSGAFNYISYRDPNLIRTLENYDGTPAFLQSLEIPKTELTKAIIGAIGEMDGYQLPDARGYTSMVRYLAGYTDEKRQQYREEILGTAPEDFVALGELLEAVKETGKVAVLGSAEAITEANQDIPGLLTVKPVM